MHIVKLTENVGVSGQILPSDVAAVVQAGYAVLINNRPDGEAPDQPSSADMAAAAEAAGLDYYHLPVNAMNFPGPDTAQMRALLDNGDKPALAFCRSGTRCANLWVATRDEAERDEAAAHARGLGYDLSMAGV